MDSESVPFEKGSVFLPKVFTQHILQGLTLQGRLSSVVLSLLIMPAPQTKVLLIKKKRKIKALHQKLVVSAKEAYFIIMDNNSIIFLLLIIAISLGWNLTKPEL